MDPPCSMFYATKLPLADMVKMKVGHHSIDFIDYECDYGAYLQQNDPFLFYLTFKWCHFDLAFHLLKENASMSPCLTWTSMWRKQYVQIRLASKFECPKLLFPSTFIGWHISFTSLIKKFHTLTCWLSSFSIIGSIPAWWRAIFNP